MTNASFKARVHILTQVGQDIKDCAFKRCLKDLHGRSALTTYNKYTYCHGYNCDVCVCVRTISSTQCTSHGLGCVQRNHHQHERQVESSSGTRPELQDHLCPHSRRQEPDCKSHIRRTWNTDNTYSFYLQSTFISQASNL